MIVKTTLLKMMSNDFQPTMKRIMMKWREPKDAFVFAQIMTKLEAEIKAYQDTVKQQTKMHGYELPNGEKSVDASAINEALLEQYGKMNSEGRLTMAGSTESETTEYFDEKEAAATCVRAYGKVMEELLREPYNFEIPRKIKIREMDLKKETLNLWDCFILEPILDLSEVGGPEIAAKGKKAEPAEK